MRGCIRRPRLAYHHPFAIAHVARRHGGTLGFVAASSSVVRVCDLRGLLLWVAQLRMEVSIAPPARAAPGVPPVVAPCIGRRLVDIRLAARSVPQRLGVLECLGELGLVQLCVV